MLGTVVELRDDLRAAALHTYRERHPDAFYAAFGDFRLYRLDVSSVRYVGGFGRMSWVSADDHATAEPDPLRPHVAGIVGHMNDDHADALVAYCRVFGRRPTTEQAEMVGVDRYGFTMLATDEGGTDRTAVRIPFGTQVDSVGEVRAAMIAPAARGPHRAAVAAECRMHARPRPLRSMSGGAAVRLAGQASQWLRCTIGSAFHVRPSP